MAMPTPTFPSSAPNPVPSPRQIGKWIPFLVVLIFELFFIVFSQNEYYPQQSLINNAPQPAIAKGRGERIAPDQNGGTSEDDHNPFDPLHPLWKSADNYMRDTDH